MRHLWVTLLLWVLAAGTASAQQVASGGAGPAEVDLDEDEELISLSRLTLTGYIQPELRYEVAADEDDRFYFQLRRGRLKFDYDLSPVGLLIQIDATEEGLGLKDAYASVALPAPDGVELKLLAGLMQIPFGFDLQQSSSRRVFPERAQMVQQLFPGERDLGIRLDAALADGLVDVQIAVQNGVPLGDAYFGDFGVADGNAMKDITARVALHVGGATFGVSGLYGEGTTLLADDPETPLVDESARFDFPRWAAGAELRYQRDLGFGALDLYGELSYAQNLLRKRASLYPANEDVEAKVLTWYVAAVQGLGDLFALGLRFDQLAPEDGDAMNILTPVAMATPYDGLRFVLAYDFHLYEGGGRANEGWLRMQVKF